MQCNIRLNHKQVHNENCHLIYIIMVQSSLIKFNIKDNKKKYIV